MRVFLDLLGPRSRVIGLIFLGLWGIGCVIFSRVDVQPIEPPRAPVSVASAVKAHLLDGSTVVYPRGVEIARDTVRSLSGVATRYDLGLQPSDALPVPLDSVAAMESFRTNVDQGSTFIVSTLATAGTLVGAGLLAVAIFGSCPTAYADSAGAPVLQAEGFSYSIAPLFESRDVDRLRVSVAPGGIVRLEVRNEAVETHYINHVELLEVEHASEELVVPDPRGRPLAVNGWVTAATATDGAGRDVRAELAAADGDAFGTDRSLLRGAATGALDDRIDLVLPRPLVDSVAVVLRARNSLLNTVLLYDFMLGARGAQALDWVGSDLARIGPAVELGSWYAGRMGMHVAVLSRGAYREVARIPDTGPIAWKDVAAVVPVPPPDDGDSLRIRLWFVADDWRIDRLAVATAVRSASARPIAPSRVLGPDGAEDSSALASLRAPDTRYLATTPGERFRVTFDVGPARRGVARTFLLAWQGYYVEWIRRAWIASGRDSTPFTPSDASLRAALLRWSAVQDDFERRFAATLIPVH